MSELRLPPDTPIQHVEGLWELCTDRAYEMMKHSPYIKNLKLLIYQNSP